MQNAIDNRGDYPYPDINLLNSNRKFILEFKKLTQWGIIDSDPYNIEIPTIKVTNKRKLIKEFKKLSILMNKNGFIESSRSFNNNFEGGGHIHIDYGNMFGNLGYGNDYSIYEYLNRNGYRNYLRRPNYLRRTNINYDYSKYNNDKEQINDLFSNFTNNLIVFIINNPWIPWAFNAPNDNESAKNPITNEYDFFDDCNQIKDNGLQLTKDFTIDSKEWAITLRQELKTFEFRFFGMPKCYNELSLHIDVAQAIFKYCFDLTMNGIVLTPTYKRFDLSKITYKKALNGLKKSCLLLNIPYSKLVKYDKITNLRVRYAYHNSVNDDESITHECMLN